MIRASASFGPEHLHGGDGVVVGTVDNHSGRRSAQSFRTPDVLRQEGRPAGQPWNAQWRFDAKGDRRRLAG